jgi:uncharacterized protein YecE (DUF72 family)
MAKVRIGTSGFTYGHWRSVFYPPKLPYKNFLNFYAKTFDTVEINSSFYHLPKDKTMERWYAETPKNFLFALKASRFITHVKKLKSCKQPLKLFLSRARILDDKLGPVLFQFPPSWKMNISRLQDFSSWMPEDIKTAFEFRHESWFTKKVYKFLESKNWALVFADTPNYPLVEKQTANFIYIRLHGHEKLYASCYTETQLKTWAKSIKKWEKQSQAIYVYFDNDAQGFAAQNAKRLKSLLA